MLEFTAKYYPAGSSTPIDVRVSVAASGETQIIDRTTQECIRHCEWATLNVSSRIGNAPRRIQFDDGALLETLDNEAIDTIEGQFGGRTHLVHRLERLSYFTAFLVLLALAIGFVSVKYILPWGSEKLAYALPADVLNVTGRQTLKLLDQAVFEPSTLSEEEQDKIRSNFEPIWWLAETDDVRVRIEFRSSQIGPNAFALPDGTIIMTDELVHLATHDEQITGVLAHEVAHIEERHVMRSVLQSSSLTLVIVMITGDLNEVTELALGIPVFLLELGYSREFEREADRRGAEIMKAAGMDPKHLADMLQHLADDCGSLCEDSWISSHPETRERIAAIKGLK